MAIKSSAGDFFANAFEALVVVVAVVVGAAGTGEESCSQDLDPRDVGAVGDGTMSQGSGMSIIPVTMVLERVEGAAGVGGCGFARTSSTSVRTTGRVLVTGTSGTEGLGTEDGEGSTRISEVDDTPLSPNNRLTDDLTASTGAAGGFSGSGTAVFSMITVSSANVTRLVLVLGVATRRSTLVGAGGEVAAVVWTIGEVVVTGGVTIAEMGAAEDVTALGV